MRVETLQLDDRREIWVLLEKLTPPQRIQFIEWCCSILPPQPVQLKVSSHSGTSHEAYYDLMNLGIHGLDLNRAAKELEQRVRKQRRG